MNDALRNIKMSETGSHQQSTAEQQYTPIPYGAPFAAFMLLLIPSSHNYKPPNRYQIGLGSSTDPKLVVSLRERYIDSIASGAYSGDRRRDIIPASAFSLSAQEIWKFIKENKDLNLASHKVARARCADISNESFAHLVGNEDWHQLKKAVQSGPVKGFGKKIKQITSTCLSEYDAQAVYFDEGIRTEQRQLLEVKMLQLIAPAYQNIVPQLHSRATDNFRKAFHEALGQGKQFVVAARDCSEYVMSVFGEECADVGIENLNYDSSQVLDRLRHDIDEHVAFVRESRVSEIISSTKAKLHKALSAPVKVLLDDAGTNTWPTIRKLFREEKKSAISRIDRDISPFDIDQKNMDQTLSDIEHYARSVVEAEATEASKEVLSRMKDRFLQLFNYDSNSNQRTWTDKKDIKNFDTITHTALSASLWVLSVTAAILLDYDVDSIADTLSSAFFFSVDISDLPTYESALIDRLNSSTWEKDPSTKTLKTPMECKALWIQFMNEMDCTINHARCIASAARERRRQRKLLAIKAIKLGIILAIKVGLILHGLPPLFGP